MSTSPWLSLIQEQQDQEPTAAEQHLEREEHTGAAEVEPMSPRAVSGAPRVPEAQRLARQSVRATAEPAVWLVDAHSASGASSVAAFLSDAAAVHAWPTGGQSPALVVCRSSVRGLRAAQRAVLDWAGGEIPVSLAGVVIVADAPGRLPRACRDLERLLSGMVPAVFHVPWIEAFRTSEDVPQISVPRSVVRIEKSIITEQENTK